MTGLLLYLFEIAMNTQQISLPTFLHYTPSRPFQIALEKTLHAI